MIRSGTEAHRQPLLTRVGRDAFGHGALASLASFSAEFRESMTARKNVLGDTGANDPSNWVPPLGSRDVHIGVLIISEEAEALDEPRNEARRLGGVSLIYQLDVSVPSSGREHFGFRDSIGGPHMRGSTNSPLPGHDEIWPGEFILGYQDESGKLPDAPVPDALGLNGSYLAFRQLHSDVAAFRRYLRDHAKSPEDEELIGAK